jgi:hypothetical protein
VADLTFQFKPIGVWTDPLTPAEARKRSPFKASYGNTLDLLFREADMLDAKHLVLQVDLQSSDIRRDGLPRTGARHGSNPGVIVSFSSKFGPLRYATDTYGDWKSNLRAIALGLEALRAVDRYGVSGRGEQYRGWTAITAGTGGGLFSTRDEAETWLRKVAAEEGIDTWASWEALYRALARRLHPDTGSSEELFKQLGAAATFLGVRGNGDA